MALFVLYSSVANKAILKRQRPDVRQVSMLIDLEKEFELTEEDVGSKKTFDEQIRAHSRSTDLIADALDLVSHFFAVVESGSFPLATHAIDEPSMKAMLKDATHCDVKKIVPISFRTMHEEPTRAVVREMHDHSACHDDLFGFGRAEYDLARAAYGEPFMERVGYLFGVAFPDGFRAPLCNTVGRDHLVVVLINGTLESMILALLSSAMHGHCLDYLRRSRFFAWVSAGFLPICRQSDGTVYVLVA